MAILIACRMRTIEGTKLEGSRWGEQYACLPIPYRHAHQLPSWCVRVYFQRSEKLSIGYRRQSSTRSREKRQIKTLDLPVVKNAIQERLERPIRSRYDAAFRLRPDISGFHKKILSWKYDHHSTIPPGEDLKPNHVPADFKDYNQYRATFEPLLLLECWAQIMRSKENPLVSYACKITSKEYVSNWVDLDLSLTDTPPRDWELTAETDILLLSSLDKQRSIMAKTLCHKKDPMGPLVRARCFAPGGMDPGLLPGSIYRRVRTHCFHQAVGVSFRHAV